MLYVLIMLCYCLLIGMLLLCVVVVLCFCCFLDGLREHLAGAEVAGDEAVPVLVVGDLVLCVLMLLCYVLLASLCVDC